MADIKFLKDRIIIDGHAETKEQCETITLLCDNLAKSKDFKTIRYENGYAEFEKVGKARVLKFVSGGQNVTIVFDNNITKVSGSGVDDYEWTTSGQTVSNVGALGAGDITFTATLVNGYILDTAIVTANTTGEDFSLTIDNDNTFSGNLPGMPGDITITITTKQVSPTTKQQIDLSTLSGWANLSSGQHSITVKAKASGYGDSAASNAVSVEKGTQVYADCLTFTGKTGDFTLEATNKKWNGTLEWSTDHTTWKTLVSTETMQSVDKKLYLRGKGNTVFYEKRNGYLKTGVEWRLSEKADCAGNIQTLLDWENPPTIISETRCYQAMFKGCTNLTSAPELPATTLANNCYMQMFEGCTNLTSAPELPATTLAEDCYHSMFMGCTNLTSTPKLPATTLAYYCYGAMFRDCTNLTSAPELPATTLASSCYTSMFFGCTGLTTAPKLPATTLANNCYMQMFEGCTNLTSAPELPATTLADGCYYAMFRDCTKLKVNSVSGIKIFTCPTTIPDGTVSGMFENTGGTFTGTPTAGNTYYYTV